MKGLRVAGCKSGRGFQNLGRGLPRQSRDTRAKAVMRRSKCVPALREVSTLARQSVGVSPKGQARVVHKHAPRCKRRTQESGIACRGGACDVDSTHGGVRRSAAGPSGLRMLAVQRQTVGSRLRERQGGMKGFRPGAVKDQLSRMSVARPAIARLALLEGKIERLGKAIHAVPGPQKGALVNGGDQGRDQVRGWVRIA